MEKISHKVAALGGVISTTDISSEAEYKRISESYGMPVEKVKELVDKAGITADMKVKAAIELVKEKAVIK